MKLSLDALQILDTIARKGSFASAAVELDRVPSSLTYSIRKLEEDLDVLLFDRRGHRAKLTETGQELLEQGRHLLLAAEELERRVKRVATGWEVELRLVVDAIIPFEHLIPLIEQFDQQRSGTRLRISHENLSGVWEALMSGRADLIIGAPSESPDSIRMNRSFQIREMPPIEWVFAVAPEHPLAAASTPIPPEVVAQYRAISVGDTGRSLPGIQAGLLCGQDTLTVPTMRDKLNAQLAGMGCGYLPITLAAPYLAAGTLIAKETREVRSACAHYSAWRTPVNGKSLAWFIEKLAQQEVQHQLIGTLPPASSPLGANQKSSTAHCTPAHDITAVLHG